MYTRIIILPVYIRESFTFLLKVKKIFSDSVFGSKVFELTLKAICNTRITKKAVRLKVENDKNSSNPK